MGMKKLFTAPVQQLAKQVLAKPVMQVDVQGAGVGLVKGIFDYVSGGGKTLCDNYAKVQAGIQNRKIDEQTVYGITKLCTAGSKVVATAVAGGRVGAQVGSELMAQIFPEGKLRSGAKGENIAKMSPSS